MMAAVLPAKALSLAKERLASLFSPAERRALMSAMLGDVLASVTGARGIDLVLVVTREPELVALARGFGADICAEPHNLGHTGAVRWALDALRRRGARAMLTVPGDVPALTSAEVEAMVLASEPGRSVVFAPSRSGLGTNGVLLRPIDAMDLRFGEPSFPNHVAAAERAGLRARVLDLPGLGLDIDTPDDVRVLLDLGAGERTERVLRETGVAARLAPQGHARAD